MKQNKNIIVFCILSTHLCEIFTSCRFVYCCKNRNKNRVLYFFGDFQSERDIRIILKATFFSGVHKSAGFSPMLRSTRYLVSSLRGYLSLGRQIFLQTYPIIKQFEQGKKVRFSNSGKKHGFEICSFNFLTLGHMNISMIEYTKYYWYVALVHKRLCYERATDGIFILNLLY